MDYGWFKRYNVLVKASRPVSCPMIMDVVNTTYPTRLIKGSNWPCQATGKHIMKAWWNAEPYCWHIRQDDALMAWKRFPYYWSLVTGGFPSQRANDAEKKWMAWHHHRTDHNHHGSGQVFVMGTVLRHNSMLPKHGICSVVSWCNSKFLGNTRKRHPVACPWGRAMGY